MRSQELIKIHPACLDNTKKFSLQLFLFETILWKSEFELRLSRTVLNFSENRTLNPFRIFKDSDQISGLKRKNHKIIFSSNSINIFCASNIPNVGSLYTQQAYSNLLYFGRENCLQRQQLVICKVYVLNRKESTTLLNQLSAIQSTVASDKIKRNEDRTLKFFYYQNKQDNVKIDERKSKPNL